MSKILYGVTSPHSALAFLRGQMHHLNECGHEVHLVCPDTPQAQVAHLCKRENTTLHTVNLSRRPSAFDDARALLRILHVVTRVRPDVVIAGTPKMSLLLLTIAKVRRVPNRVYLCHGLRFEGLTGHKRKVFQVVERMLCSLATSTVAVSRSVAVGLQDIGVRESSVTVLGRGSPNGVDTERFALRDAETQTKARETLSVPQDKFALLFVGRLTGDKGISTLLHIVEALPSVHLLLTGTEEPQTEQDELIIHKLREHSRVTYFGSVRNVEMYYAASDLLLLPTKREGLPTVILEAGSMGLPTVATKATGTVDAILDGETGLLVDQGDVDLFAAAVKGLISSRKVLNQMGLAAHTYVKENFDQHHVWAAWETLIHQLDVPVGLR